MINLRRIGFQERGFTFVCLFVYSKHYAYTLVLEGISSSCGLLHGAAGNQITDRTVVTIVLLLHRSCLPLLSIPACTMYVSPPHSS